MHTQHSASNVARPPQSGLSDGTYSSNGLRFLIALLGILEATTYPPLLVSSCFLASWPTIMLDNDAPYIGFRGIRLALPHHIQMATDHRIDQTALLVGSSRDGLHWST